MIRFPIPLVLLFASLSVAEGPGPVCPVTDAPKPQPVHVDLHEEITAAYGTKVAKQIDAAVTAKAPGIIVDISSPGGDVNTGLVITDAMGRASEAKIPVICVVTQAQSMAAFILEVGCSIRLMHANGFLMFHEVYFRGDPIQNSGGKQPHSQQALQHAANILDDDNQRMAVLCGPRMGMSAKAFRAWIYQHDRYLDAAEATELKLIDGVIP